MVDKILWELIKAILEKGNNVEIRQSKDGIKVYEVSKKIKHNFIANGQ